MCDTSQVIFINNMQTFTVSKIYIFVGHKPGMCASLAQLVRVPVVVTVVDVSKLDVVAIYLSYKKQNKIKKWN